MSRLLIAPSTVGVLLVTSEWLFYATKPSFLSSHSYYGKLGVLLGAASLTLVAMVAGLATAGSLLGFLGRRGERMFRLLVALGTTLLTTTLIVLLVDNFTYTLFGVGIRRIHSAWASVAVALVVGALLVYVLIATLRSLGPAARLSGRARAAGLAVAAVLAVVASWPPGPIVDETPAGGGEKYNIIIFGVDALEASQMGIYGYERDTTPFLSGRKDEFLVSSNSYTNNSKSWGSIGSLLNGKASATTKLMFPPDVLSGKHQFEHLPGLLKDLGYTSLDMSLRWYSDPPDMNMRCGFDRANFRTVRDCQNISPLFKRALIRFTAVFLLFQQIGERVTERLELLNPWVANPSVDVDLSRVGQPDHYWSRDDARLAEALSFMAQVGDQPFFINLHLMGVHGPSILLDEPHFSLGRTQVQHWERDFYDDAVLRLDRQFQAIYEQLEKLGKLESTVLVITSDHGRRWTADVRLPLIFRFPGGNAGGVLSGNTQRLDIAPTLLASMGRRAPDWMEGDSLLGADRPDLEARPIVQVAPPERFDYQRAGRILLVNIAPPFYSLGRVHVISCDVRFTWLLEPNIWTQQRLDGQHRNCDGKSLTRREDYIALIRKHLATRGYDIGSIGDPEQGVRIEHRAAR